MMIKYSDFINEKLNSRFNTLWEELQGMDEASIKRTIGIDYTFRQVRTDLIKKIKGISTYYDSYYSSLANNSQSNPEEDFEKMQSMLTNSGYPIDIIGKIFDEKVNKLLSEDFKQFVSNNFLNDINGYVDVYLYFLNEKLNLNVKIKLGGDGWSDFDSIPEEWMVKYSYGYHKNPYGLLLLKSRDLTPEEFIEKTMENISDYLIEYIPNNILYDLRRHRNDTLFNIDFKKYIITDDDGCIIYYERLTDDYNTNYNDNLESKFFRDKILYILSEFPLKALNTTDTGEYIHIHK